MFIFIFSCFFKQIKLNLSTYKNSQMCTNVLKECCREHVLTAPPLHPGSGRAVSATGGAPSPLSDPAQEASAWVVSTRFDPRMRPGTPSPKVLHRACAQRNTSSPQTAACTAAGECLCPWSPCDDSRPEAAHPAPVGRRIAQLCGAARRAAAARVERTAAAPAGQALAPWVGAKDLGG